MSITGKIINVSAAACSGLSRSELVLQQDQELGLAFVIYVIHWIPLVIVLMVVNVLSERAAIENVLMPKSLLVFLLVVRVHIQANS